MKDEFSIKKMCSIIYWELLFYVYFDSIFHVMHFDTIFLHIFLLLFLVYLMLIMILPAQGFGTWRKIHLKMSAKEVYCM